jgi:hypothetical protein
MKYYVPVGHGGVFFRMGMAVTGLMGSVVYWRASYRRRASRATELLAPVRSSAAMLRRPEVWNSSAAGLSAGQMAGPAMITGTVGR